MYAKRGNGPCQILESVARSNCVNVPLNVACFAFRHLTHIDRAQPDDATAVVIHAHRRRAGLLVAAGTAWEFMMRCGRRANTGRCRPREFFRLLQPRQPVAAFCKPGTNGNSAAQAKSRQRARKRSLDQVRPCYAVTARARTSPTGCDRTDTRATRSNAFPRRRRAGRRSPQTHTQRVQASGSPSCSVQVIKRIPQRNHASNLLATCTAGVFLLRRYVSL